MVLCNGLNFMFRNLQLGDRWTGSGWQLVAPFLSSGLLLQLFKWVAGLNQKCTGFPLPSLLQLYILFYINIISILTSPSNSTSSLLLILYLIKLLCFTRLFLSFIPWRLSSIHYSHQRYKSPFISLFIKFIIQVKLSICLNVHQAISHFNYILSQQFQMNCPQHGKPIQYVCKAMSCDFTMLCEICRTKHLQSLSNRQKHVQSIMSIKSAIAEAEGKLGEQKQTLQQLLSPFNNEEEMHRMIEKQKKQLNDERQEIIRQINNQFDAQIRELENSNQLLLGKKYQDFPIHEIEQKLEHINQLQRQYKKDHQTLRQTLAFSIELLMDKIRDQHPEVVSSMQMQSNQYWSYGKIKHDFFLSKLTLKKEVFNYKLLKKMQNNSKLYFLIDNYDQDKYLHYFSPTDNSIRVYNIELQKWKSHSSTLHTTEVPTHGATIHDPKSGRFYLVGGTNRRGKSNHIIWYHKEQGWGQALMNTARSSAMVAMIQSGKKNHDLLLIAGGIGESKKHLKLCELFDPQTGSIEKMPPMNFGVSSGTLVTFNGNKVFRIGGLGQFNRESASICEIVEKFEYENGNGKWSYVELQVVNPDLTNKFKLFHSNQAAIQINPNQILVFGGWSHGNMGVKESYVVEVEQITIKGKKSYRYYVRWINQKPLISGEGFADLRPIIHNRRVVSLQNITHGQTQVLEKEKKLIEFDMYKWYEYENIVNI